MQLQERKAGVKFCCIDEKWAWEANVIPVCFALMTQVWRWSDKNAQGVIIPVKVQEGFGQNKESNQR